MKELIDEILAGRAWQTGELKTSEIDFNESVVKACEANFCGMYNKTWLCPPGVGKLSDLKEKYTKYENAYVFTTKWDIEDSFDIEGMNEARVHHDKLTRLLKTELENKKQDFAILGAGGCNICEKCAYPDSPCRFPLKAFPSVEACGIQVMDLSKKVNVKYINGQDTVTYFSVVFYN